MDGPGYDGTGGHSQPPTDSASHVSIDPPVHKLHDNQQLSLGHELDGFHPQPSVQDSKMGYRDEMIDQRIEVHRQEGAVRYVDDALPAYRPPEALPTSQPSTPIPVSAVVQEVAPSPSWSIKAADDAGPSPFMDLDEPELVRLGPGLLPSTLLKPPLVPFEQGWEVAVVDVPPPDPLPVAEEPKAWPPPPLPTPPAEPSVGAPDQLIDTSMSSTSLNMLASVQTHEMTAPRAPLPPPPTVEEVRASLPQLPADVQKGAVVFDTERWAWWVVPAGDDTIPPSNLTSAHGHYSLRRLAIDLKSVRNRMAAADEEELRVAWWIPVKEDVLNERVVLDPPPLDKLPTIEEPAPLIDLSTPMDITPSDTEVPSPLVDVPVPLEKEPQDQLYMSATNTRWVIIPAKPAVRGVLDSALVRAFVKSREEDPPVGVQHGGEAALVVVLTMVVNTLFRSEHRAIKVNNKNFASKVGWDAHSEQLFKQLGFVVHDPAEADEPTLICPPKEPEAWMQTRARLMRAWIELSVYLDHYRLDVLHMNLDAQSKHTNCVQRLLPIDHAFASACAATQSQIPRTQQAGFKSEKFIRACNTLGINPLFWQVNSAYVGFAYRMQSRCDAPAVSRYLQALKDVIAEWTGGGMEDLHMLMVMEESRGVHTQDAVDAAYASIPGLSRQEVEEILMIEQHEIPADYVVSQFGAAYQDLANKHAQGSEELSKAKAHLIDQLEVIADSRKGDGVSSVVLREAVKQARRVPMSVDEAYRILQCEPETDDDMLQVLFEIRMVDNPARVDQYKDALRSIADLRGSKALRNLADTGAKAPTAPVEVPQPVSADLPVGLNNIGNTCYLNSLLQYFYTLSDLRTIVASAERYKEDVQTLSAKSEKRVGGRAVSRKEIERSIRFIDLLGTLFTNLEYSTTASIEPERELAYLALVTPQDEASDMGEPTPGPKEQEGTSQDTDITLVDESPAVPVASPPPLRPRLLSTGSTSVLGKRTSEDRDDPVTDAGVGGSSSAPAAAIRNMGAFRTDTAMSERSDVTTEPSPPTSPALSPSSAKSPRYDLQQDSIRHATREMTIAPEEGLLQRAPQEAGPIDQDVSQLPPALLPPSTPRIGPPPLPPRKLSQQPPFMQDNTNGGMMFGKQHDVSECLDNCLFQIDAALDSAKLKQTNERAESVVKDLFFGKARQTITFANDSKPSAEHDQEVIFNHLLLNVGETGTSRDLHDSLAEYYTPEPVEIAGKAAVMKEVPVAYPALLHFQLQRAQFDRQTGRAYKSNAFLGLPLEMSLDRYLCSPKDPRMVQSEHLTSQIKVLRDRILTLQKPRGTSVASSLAFLLDNVVQPGADWLATSNIDDELRGDLAGHKQAVSDEIQQAEAEIARLKALVEDLWKDDQQTRYTLTSVFMHRGDTGFGHYWLYQRNVPTHPEEWFKYNDSTVTKVKPEEVLSDTGTNATAYLAVYQRADRPGLVDTVHRTLL